MQEHHPSIDRVQLLASTLASQLTDAHDRDQLRHRLNEITRRWAQVEQDLISGGESLEEMKHFSESFDQLRTLSERWIVQTRELIQELTNSKTVEMFDQLIPKGKTMAFEFPTYIDQVQRLRARLNRLAQTNKTTNGAQKVIEFLRSFFSVQTIIFVFFIAQRSRSARSRTDELSRSVGTTTRFESKDSFSTQRIQQTIRVLRTVA